MVILSLFVYLLFLLQNLQADVMCEDGFCKDYEYDVGCASPAQHCQINNATHKGIWLPSPTTCNCCKYCLPLYGENDHCSGGGPGTGITVGRCGDGLTCTPDENVNYYCKRMETPCLKAQNEYDERHDRGETGALEQRPLCDGKGNYAAFECLPTQTCFCQSENGERLFGEFLNTGSSTSQNIHCGCSLLHYKIQKYIAPGSPYPVLGPRCTSDGNFNPVQCYLRNCFCVNPVTGVRVGDANYVHPQTGMRNTVDLDKEPLSKLTCYDPALDLFPHNTGDPPYNYTTPCLETIEVKLQLIEQSLEEGYNVDYASSVEGCMPDGTFGRITSTRNGTQICVDEHGKQIGDYEAWPNTPEFDAMDCRCAQTSLLLGSSSEPPVCCQNGNFRTIQCRRGLCRCVDSNGRQTERESADVEKLSCYIENWRSC